MVRSQRRHSVTLKDVANATGFSISTVSRALSNNPIIPESTREIVHAAAKKLHYRPNAQAQALRNQRTNIIGLLVPDIAHPFFTALTATIQRKAHALGFSALLSNTEENGIELDNAIEFMGNQRVDGLIVVPHRDSFTTIQDFVASGTPVVTVDRTIPQSNIPAVVSDPKPGMEAALLALSENEVPLGYLSGPLDTGTGEQRLEVAQQICNSRHIDLHQIAEGGHQIIEGRKGTAALLDSGTRAILTGDTLMTFGAIQEIHSRGLRIGHDVALVGFDESPMLSLLETPLTTIDQQVTEIADHAFENLRQMIVGNSVISNVSIPTVMHARASHSLRR